MKETDPILLVEDDQLDQKSIKKAFRDLRITNPLIIVESGIQALEYLRKPDCIVPCLILLDLNMPQMNGIEFLKIYKQQFKPLLGAPVVILTTSEEESNVVDSYQLCVSGYILKPIDYTKFIETMRTIHLYWSLSLTPSFQAMETK